MPSAGAFSSSAGSSNRVLSRQESIIPTKFKAGGLLKETMSPPWPWRLRHFVLEETSLKYFVNADAVGTGQLKGCMLLANARLSNTKTPRQGKFAFRLNGSGSSTKQRPSELKFILSGRTREETLEWVAALERLGVPSSFDPLLLPSSGDAASASASASPARLNGAHSPLATPGRRACGAADGGSSTPSLGSTPSSESIDRLQPVGTRTPARAVVSSGRGEEAPGWWARVVESLNRCAVCKPKGY
eukprot:Transcript_6175.p1 GENE.Transcript_6175~~Transcript_6175.p1  ORF type:complete len:245 (-),score=43.99 Transcript_6175:164-898(-)